MHGWSLVRGSAKDISFALKVSEKVFYEIFLGLGITKIEHQNTKKGEE